MRESLDNSNCQYDIHEMQNYTNMVVGEHGIQTSNVVVVALLLLRVSFDVFWSLQVHIPYYV
jgi:hypothetical protein